MGTDDTTMLAIWFENGEVRVRDDLPMPTAARGEAVVRVRLAGICGTDLQLLAGYAGFRGVPGHEFVGEVVGGAPEWNGRRVVAEINVGCGACAACAQGVHAHCERRRVLGIRGLPGAFASLVRVPVANLHEVPAGVSDATAVFTEPLAAACRVLQQLSPLSGQRVVIFGAGKLGQLLARVLALQRCDLTVATRSERKRALLPAGVTGVPPAQVPARSFDIAVDCTGQAAGAETARAAVRPRGTLLIKSTHTGVSTLDLNAVVVDELTVLGSRCGPFAEALALLASGTIEPGPLIDATLPLAEAPDALRTAAAPGALKVLLAP